MTSDSKELTTATTLAELKGLNLTGLKANEIGLQLLILKIAQREANRIEKLSSVIDALEDQIFNKSIIEHLSPSEQIARYTLALQATQQSSAYINQAVKAINWSDIEMKIMILSESADSTGEKVHNNTSDLQNAALRLLHQLNTEK